MRPDRLESALSFALALLLMLFLDVSGTNDTCPSVCHCKWKSGKRTVECVDRGLITIPQGIDPETQVLDMSGNNLQILPRETFAKSSLLNLQKLFLRSCRLGQIDEKALRGLTNLVELDLSHNLLTSVPTLTLADAPSLRELSLAQNPISKLDANAFQGISGLIKLDLSHCELHIIAANAFHSVESLEYLHLDGNRLSELRPKTVDVLSKLHGVALHDNPWFCDCHLRATKIWLTNHNIPYPVPPACEAGPQRLQGRTFSELYVDDFACNPDIKLDSRYVEGTVGDNSTILCRVISEPPARITWHWAGRQLTNNSAFTVHQRVYILEDSLTSEFDQVSSLVITNSQETTSGSFFCLAKNAAGSAEANFTLHVSKRIAGIALLGNGQIAGLGAALMTLIVFILIVIIYLLFRIKRTSYSDTKSPAAIEIVSNGVVAHKAAITPVIETSSFTERKFPTGNGNEPNPVQKPPRLAEVPNHSYTRTSNPDLINDTRSQTTDLRPGSGEYTRTSECLYPQGLWEASQQLSSSPNDFDSNDKTPIISGDKGGFPVEDFRMSGEYPSDFGLPQGAVSPTGSVPSAKTLRVWQRGVPVLPPVSALKRVLTRSSPDEGYQEGCGTDV
nr:PREDICTED: leucine-rich repeat, immunoglobulin-like domain and transmembrane domain-containing protein 2 [Bemisia tabaci]